MDFSYFECGVAPLGPPESTQPLLLTLDEGYLLAATLPELLEQVRAYRLSVTCTLLTTVVVESLISLTFLRRVYK